MVNTDNHAIAETDKDLGDYLYFGGQKIPIRHEFSPFNPELCRAIGVDDTDMRED